MTTTVVHYSVVWMAVNLLKSFLVQLMGQEISIDIPNYDFGGKEIRFNFKEEDKPRLICKLHYHLQHPRTNLRGEELALCVDKEFLTDYSDQASQIEQLKKQGCLRLRKAAEDPKHCFD